MKQQLLCLLMLFGVSTTLLSQECGTLSAPNVDYQEVMNGRIPDPDPICVDVFVHIVRKTNGTGGLDLTLVDDMISNLNTSFNPHKIYFNVEGQDFIDNDAFYYLQEQSFDPLIETTNQADAINAYFVKSGPFEGKAPIGGNSLVVLNYLALTNVVSHEMGHCLNLHHTHHGYGNCGDVGSCRDNLPPYDCEMCGDFVCDTPYDPCVRNNVDSNCQYIPNNGYDPDVSNFMSFAPKSCRDHFTIGQADRMRLAISNSSVLQQVVSCECATAKIAGGDLACDGFNSTFNLLGATPPVSWTLSTNLLLIESDDTSITVRAVSSTSGSGSITADYDCGQTTKDIWVGTPGTPSSLNGPTGVISGSQVQYYGGKAEGATSYEWRLPYPFEVVSIFDYFGDDWQMLPSNSYQSVSAFTGYEGADGNVQLWGTNPCGNGGDVRLLYVEHGGSGGGVEVAPNDDPGSNNEMDFIIYPNPTSNNFTVQMAFKQYETTILQLYSIYGNMVMEITTDKEKESVSVQSLPNGVYFLKAINNATVITKQIQVYK